MKTLELKVIRGPNYWSDLDKHLIVLKLGLNEAEQQGKVNPDNFESKIKKLFPGIDDDLFKKPFDQLICEAVAYIAKDLQNRAEVKCDYAKTVLIASKGECYIIFPYVIVQAGLFAASTAVKIITTLIEGKDYEELHADIDNLVSLKMKYALGATTNYILSEVKRRGIPYRQFNDGSLIILGYGLNQKKIRTAVTDTTSGLGIEIAGDKEETKKLLSEENIPVPHGIMVTSENELRERIGEVQFPIVMKPLNGNHGRGITTDINSLDDAIFGFNLAKQVSETVIAEEFITGDDYRFLLVNYKLVAATKRTPAHVTGDGYLSIKQLIEKENENPERGKGEDAVLAFIVTDKITERILSNKHLTLDSLLPEGETLFLKYTANISAGGTATDVTDEVHPENKFMAERISRLFNLDICGLDIMATAIDVPLNRKTGAVIEVNAGPGLRMHSDPQKGKPRNVAAPIVDMLFPENKTARIPVVAVADSKGANIITRLISYFSRLAKHNTGYNSSDGIYIQGHLTTRGNATGFRDAQEVLYDPTIDFAVIQCGDKDIFYSGLAFDLCDISVFSGFAEKHFQLNGNNDLRDEIKLKTILIKTTVANGYSIINADIDLMDRIEKNARSKIALFSTGNKNEKIKSHFKNGGLAAAVERERIVIYKEGKIIPITELKNIPVISEEDKELTLRIILPAILAAVAKGFSLHVIEEGLRSFKFPPVGSGRKTLNK